MLRKPCLLCLLLPIAAYAPGVLHGKKAPPMYARAVGKMKFGKYDLVILDLKMPKRSGMEVLRAIRTEWPEIPVVMVTGYGSIDTAIEATKLGAMNFLAKPFTPAELTKVAEEALVS